MKSKRKSLLNKDLIDNRINTEKVYAGGNNSDVTYTDSHKDNNGGWDVAVLSVIDVIDSSVRLDKP